MNPLHFAIMIYPAPRLSTNLRKDPKQRIDDLKKWSDAVNEYPNLNQNSNS